jgi:hypothetical protein
MDKNFNGAFEAITAFVGDLWDVFQTSKPTPLALYHRMVKHINKEHSESGIRDSVNGFIEFFAKYEKCIIDDHLDSIPRGVVIRYGRSEKVYLEIQKYIHQSSNDVETRDAIRKHLITISSILEPDTRKFEELEKKNGLNIDDSTPEGKFLSNIMKDAQNSVGDINSDNPTAAMSSIFTNVVPNLIGGLQNGVNSGNLDMYKLMGTMQQVIGAMIPPPPASTGDEAAFSSSSENKDLQIEEIKE